jgi:hypothetical protein
MDKLADKIRDIPSIDDVTVYGYEDWFNVYEKLKLSADNVILIGHSFGALAAYKIVSVLNKKVFPLVISFDYSPYYSGIVAQPPNGICPPNVTNALNFYQKVDPLVRGVQLKRIDGTEQRIRNVQSEMMHIEIDKASELHDEVITTIKYNV